MVKFLTHGLRGFNGVVQRRRNSTSLDSCQHDDISIVSVVWRRWTAPLKPRRPCVKHFTTFYTLLKRFIQGPFFSALGPLFCALVREETIFAVCKRCANEGFACMCKEKTCFSHFFYNFFFLKMVSFKKRQQLQITFRADVIRVV